MTWRTTFPPERSDSATDNPDELFDLVDERDTVIGVVRRGEAHRNPALIHRSAQTLVFDGAGRALLQLRSARKDLYPGYYCASASGHVIAGDTYEATARRELEEELGVSAALTELGVRLVRSQLETEMTALFVARCDGPFRFNRIETDGGAFFTWDALLAARVRLPMTPALVTALDEVERRRAAGTFSLPS
ncbi:MAG TPA: NUDIX domain-containing protein [Ktedonobacterales bacterium]